MKTVRMTIDQAAPAEPNSGRVDLMRLDATTEADLARQTASDEAEAILDAAKSRLEHPPLSSAQ